MTLLLGRRSSGDRTLLADYFFSLSIALCDGRAGFELTHRRTGVVQLPARIRHVTDLSDVIQRLPVVIDERAGEDFPVRPAPVRAEAESEAHAIRHGSRRG